MIKAQAQAQSSRSVHSKLEHLKIGDSIILELVFAENQFSMYSELTAIDLDKSNQTGKARFNRAREMEKYKTLNESRHHTGRIISLNYDDILMWITKP